MYIANDLEANINSPCYIGQYKNVPLFSNSSSIVSPGLDTRYIARRAPLLVNWKEPSLLVMLAVRKEGGNNSRPDSIAGLQLVG
jgi:hypothetical protein